VGGKIPLALIDAPQPGTGKSLLAELVCVVATGRNAAMMTAPSDEDEWRKKITTQLRSGSAIVIIDNVDRELSSIQLCSALTAYEWRDRALGTNTEVCLPQRCVWMATGNNLRIGTELARRSYWIRLNAKSSRPWASREFKHPRLLEWATRRRGQLVHAVLTMGRAWFAAGKPLHNGPSLGGFEEWSAVVGGILGFVGVNGFLGNLNELYNRSDMESAQWEVFLRALWREFGTEPFSTAKVVSNINEKDTLREALPDPLAEALQANKAVSHRLGREFSKRAERRYGDKEQLFLERAGDDRHNKVGLWRVVVEPNPANLSLTKEDSNGDRAGFAGIASQSVPGENPANPAIRHQLAETMPLVDAGSEIASGGGER
jgi:hypothetical protein